MAEFAVANGENDRTVLIAVGDVVKIELPENPTTGFRWQVMSAGDGVLSLRSDDFAASPDPAIGAGGLRRFRWSAVGAGTARLRLELKRSWEVGRPRSAFAIRVVVA